MPIRDIVVTVTILALLPVCFARPWIGALTWAWLGYMNPHRLTWGFAYETPFALLVALATLAGLLLTRDRKPFLWTRETLLLLALWAWFGVTTLFAEYPDAALDKLLQVSKILLMALVTIPLFQDRERLRWLLVVIAASLGYYGFKGGIFSILYGGESNIYGPPGSFIASNNELGLALNMVLPLLVFLARDVPRVWMRVCLRVVACCSVIAIIFTYSRGAVLGLAIVLGALFLRARQRVLLAIVLVIALLTLNSFAPERWIARMETLANYQEDGSARARLTTWWVASRIAMDHPIVGGGFRVLLDVNTYRQYGVEPTGRGIDGHSLYFNLLAEHGFVGVGLFGAMMLCTLLTLRRARKQAANSPDRTWIANYAQMLQISFIAYLTTGAFVSVAYFDFAYQLILIAVILGWMAAQPVVAIARPAPVAAIPRGRRAVLAQRR